eukprot:TRINITY_DN17827_c0_g1_i1.p1 TRINITY_DN17827_c0_g1~~TRINITY_DN17827_c0_g1_i1.p1  ORF type:complete len:482 (+),score=82.87 TRINITY_DN17827_c0_g1_i1:57-1502(+)
MGRICYRNAWCMLSATAWLLTHLQGCSLADLAEASEEILDGRDLLGTAASMCPNHFMHGENVSTQLAQLLMMTKGDVLSSCPLQVSGFLRGLLAAHGPLKSRFEHKTSLGSFRAELNMTAKAADIFIQVVSNFTCDADLFDYISLDLDVQYLPEFHGSKRREASIEMTRDFAKVVSAQLKVAVTAGLLTLIGTSNKHGTRHDHDMLLNLCAAPLEMRKYICAAVTNSTEAFTGDFMRSPFSPLKSRGPGLHIDASQASKAHHDTGGLVQAISARPWKKSSSCKEALAGHDKDNLGIPPKLILKAERSLAGSARAGYDVHIEGQLFRKVEATAREKNCHGIATWMSEHLYLNRSDPNAFAATLRRQILFRQRGSLQRLFKCPADAASFMNASAIEEDMDRLVSRARHLLDRTSGNGSSMHRAPVSDVTGAISVHAHSSQEPSSLAPACLAFLFSLAVLSAGLALLARRRLGSVVTEGEGLLE